MTKLQKLKCALALLTVAVALVLSVALRDADILAIILSAYSLAISFWTFCDDWRDARRRRKQK